MKKVLLYIVGLFVASHYYCQNKVDSITTTWVKYIVINDSDQILLRYDTYYKAWELPGSGYEGPITIRNLIDTVADFLGFKHNGLRLGGLFTYQKPKRYRVTIKPVNVLHFTGYKNGISFIDTSRTKWFSFEDAKKIIPYPTMVLILQQLITYPETVWGSAFEEYNYNQPEGTKWRIIEPFYKLN